MSRWIYISGRGHSGSTMLDAMLGNAADIESVGELVSGMGRYDGLCSCGATFRDCQYWQGVRERFEKTAGEPWDSAVASSVGQAHIKRFFPTMLAGKARAWVSRLRTHSEAIAGAVTNGATESIVDSSKEISRALFLLRFVPESKVVHLVRNPANILESQYFRLKSGTGFRFLRRTFHPKKMYFPFLLIGCVGWIVGNALSEIVRMYGRDRFLVVKYEDILSQPVAELDRIEQFVGIPLGEVKAKVQNNQPFQIGHNVGGNHMRMAGEFVLDTKKGSRGNLPKRYHILVKVLCFPLLKRYGY